MKEQKQEINESTIFTSMVDVRKWLGKAKKYWEISYNHGTYDRCPHLSVIAQAMLNTEEAGYIKEQALLASERVIF